MNIRNLIFGGLWIALITGSIGCGKIVSPVDTYGFNEAFEEKIEPLKGMVALGEDSIKLAHEVLKAVSDRAQDGALSDWGEATDACSVLLLERVRSDYGL